MPKDLFSFAEREGFEPPVPVTQDNGFRDRPDRPLRHLSSIEIVKLEKMTAYAKDMPHNIIKDCCYYTEINTRPVKNKIQQKFTSFYKDIF